MDSIAFCIPVDIDLESILVGLSTLQVKHRLVDKLTGKERIIESEWSGIRAFKYLKRYKHFDKCYYLIDLIREHTLRDKIGPEDFVSLSTEILNNVVDRKTRRTLISILESAGIIDVFHKWKHDGNDIEAGECKRYRINARYWSTDTVTHNASVKLETKIKASNMKRTNELLQSPFHPEYKAQRDQFLDNPRLIDKERAFYMAELMLLAGRNGIRIDKRDRIPKELNKRYLNKVKRRYDRMVDTINKLSNGVHNFKVSNKVDRVCTTITNAHRSLKAYYLDRNGLPLVSIDFSCSHTYHLVCHLEEALQPPPSSNNLYMAPVELEGLNLRKLADEVQEIKHILISDGTIYKQIAEWYEKKHHKPYSRDFDENIAKMKEYWNMHFLYGKHSNWGVSKWIKSLFPEISRYIGKVGKKKFACILLKSEAYLLNNLIIREIATSPDCVGSTFLSQFDALFVDIVHAGIIYDTMHVTAERYFGFKPTLKEEILEHANSSAIRDMIAELQRIGVSPPQEPIAKAFLLASLQGQSTSVLELGCGYQHSQYLQL